MTAWFVIKTPRIRLLPIRYLALLAFVASALGFTTGVHATASFGAQAGAQAEITQVTDAAGNIIDEVDIFNAISTTATLVGNPSDSATGDGVALASFDGTDGTDRLVFDVSANASGSTTSDGTASASVDATVTVVINNLLTSGPVTVDLRFADGIGSSVSISLTTPQDASGPVSASTSCTAGQSSPCTTGIVLLPAVGPAANSASSLQPVNVLSPEVVTSFSFSMTAMASGSVASTPAAQVPEPGVVVFMVLGLFLVGWDVMRRREGLFVADHRLPFRAARK